MSDTPRTITPADLAAARDGDRAPLVIDVLAPASFDACRVAGAHSACVYEMAFAGKVADLASDPATPLVVYGAGDTTREAHEAADKLARAGYTDVQILEGGLAAWHAAGLPLEGEAGAPAASPAPPVLGNGTWRLDREASWLRWVGRNPNGFHDGGVGLGGGTVTIAGGKVEGRIAIDVRSLRNFDLEGNEYQKVLIDHLLADDFLFAERFPAAAFEINAVTPRPDAALTTPTHRVEGTLELRGVRAPLSFDATVSALKDDGLAVEAHFELDRTRWGMLYGSARFFAHLGMHAVFDHVGIAMKLVLKPA